MIEMYNILGRLNLVMCASCCIEEAATPLLWINRNHSLEWVQDTLSDRLYIKQMA